MDTLYFTGHETFYCRNYWLKKGLGFAVGWRASLTTRRSLNLGVGKNMVTAIRFWLKAFALVDEDEQPNDLCIVYSFTDKGWNVDPFHGRPRYALASCITTW